MTIRTVIVDDSPAMRGLLALLLRQDPQIEVVGSAGTAAQARKLIKAQDPDVITLDVEMPEMDGLAFLDRIMKLRPTPVVMVSSHTARGAEATVRALELGAVDCYAKPTGDDGHLLSTDKGRLAGMVRQAALCLPRRPVARGRVAPTADFRWNGRMIAIAASTGGVEAIGSLLESFPANCPPTIIVQHMPADFTRMFAARLDGRVAPRVQEAANGMSLDQGNIYIAPGGARHLIVRGRTHPTIRLVEGDPVNGHRPSADSMFRSLAAFPADRAVGVILTGMGEDGARGLAALRSAGFPTLGQSEDSALIYGMPRAAAELGALDALLDLGQIAKRLMEMCGC